MLTSQILMEHDHALVNGVLTVVGLMMISAVAWVAFKRTPIPYTTGLVLVGVLLGHLPKTIPGVTEIQAFQLSPPLIMFIFLPTLIFESSFNTNARLLVKNIGPVMLLAAPGLLASTAIVAGLMTALGLLPAGPALLFGALISATDPVAVIALFHELGAPKRLTILVEGESLFNDATAIVAFKVVQGVLAAGVSASVLGGAAVSFFVVFGGGLVLGLLIGWMTVQLLGFVRDDPLVQVTLSTIAAYLSFIAADHFFHLSGVMATLGAGLTLGYYGLTRFTPEVKHYMHQFWEYAAFAANTFIFLLVGLSVNLHALWALAGAIVMVLGVVLFSRAAVVYAFVGGYNLVKGKQPASRVPMAYQHILFWGGLRGAVALALAMSIPHDFPHRDEILNFSIGMVLFTLIAGSPSMALLMGWLKLNEPGLGERTGLLQAILKTKTEALFNLKTLQTGGYYSQRILNQVGEEIQKAANRTERELANLRETHASQFARVIWSEAMTLERGVYSKLFEKGLLDEDLYRELMLEAELRAEVLDEGGSPPMRELLVPKGSAVLLDKLVGAIEKWLPRWHWVQHRRLAILAHKTERDEAIAMMGEEVARMIGSLGSMGGDPQVAARCGGFYRLAAEKARVRLDSMANTFPEYALAMQERAVRQAVLEAEARELDRLAHTGALPDHLAGELRQKIRHRRDQLAKIPVETLAPNPEELLQRVPMFSSLTPETFKHLAKMLIPHTLISGTDIVRQGDHGDSLFVIARGVVGVWVSANGMAPFRVARLSAGEFFGEMALLSAMPRTATVRAATDCQVYELRAAEVRELAQELPVLKDALQTAFKERRRELEALGGKSAVTEDNGEEEA